MFWAIIPVLYTLIVFALDQRFHFFTQNTQTMFEIVFFSISCLLFYSKGIAQNFHSRFTKNFFIWAALSIIAGAITFLGIAHVGALAPFDFKDFHLLLWLLFIGPIIEELIFRHALLISINRIIKNKLTVICLISILFSFAHFRIIIGLPDDFEPKIIRFIYYQTAYTFIISLFWSYYRLHYKSLSATIVLHILYNSGFAIAGFLSQ